MDYKGTSIFKDQEVKKGTIRREVAGFSVEDMNVSNIITNALIEKGYDIDKSFIKDNCNTIIGENITVYMIENR
ncbi:MAG TPA: hypothetical protein VK190_02415 [Pseudoneobacillus sp.]|nr:hypothetical protein [Pseudoneobacillus sp.]